MGLVLVEQLLWCLCPPEFVPPTRLFKDLLSCPELQQILGPSLLGIIQVNSFHTNYENCELRTTKITKIATKIAKIAMKIAKIPKLNRDV
jgi:hypothetical protein